MTNSVFRGSGPDRDMHAIISAGQAIYIAYIRDNNYLRLTYRMVEIYILT